MTASGSENRQRKIKRTVRLTRIEDALLVTNAGISGLSIASYLRTAALKMPPPCGSRRPSVDQQLAVQLLSEIGRLRTAFDDAVASTQGVDCHAIETAIHDLSDTRLILFQSMGLAP